MAKILPLLCILGAAVIMAVTDVEARKGRQGNNAVRIRVDFSTILAVLRELNRGDLATALAPFETNFKEGTLPATQALRDTLAGIIEQVRILKDSLPSDTDRNSDARRRRGILGSLLRRYQEMTSASG
ncbi:unnamed protein product [Notodromas monacha]|uniref:Uncharacterized protein n=1 Tax=Notodromas monacha TaxID=399045 RepID=A0A7R9BPC3_9CRUS|nr:unnamed protein product [Notodromas monacha]CAG0918341.1 unnamed protein product [Notodromas monacha]